MFGSHTRIRLLKLFLLKAFVPRDTSSKQKTLQQPYSSNQMQISLSLVLFTETWCLVRWKIFGQSIFWKEFCSSWRFPLEQPQASNANGCISGSIKIESWCLVHMKGLRTHFWNGFFSSTHFPQATTLSNQIRFGTSNRRLLSALLLVAIFRSQLLLICLLGTICRTIWWYCHFHLRYSNLCPSQQTGLNHSQSFWNISFFEKVSVHNAAQSVLWVRSQDRRRQCFFLLFLYLSFSKTGLMATTGFDAVGYHRSKFQPDNDPRPFMQTALGCTLGGNHPNVIKSLNTMFNVKTDVRVSPCR